MGTGSKKNIRKGHMSEKKDKRTDVKAIIYVAIGILLAFSTYTDLAGVLSVLSRKTMYNICGVIVYLIPIYLVYFGIDTIRSKGTIQYSRRFFSITLLAIVIWLICSSISIQIVSGSMYSNEGFVEMIKKMKFSSNYSIHGGFLGFIIAYPLSKLIGYIGSYILYGSLILIGMILLMDIILYDIYITFKKTINSIVGNNFSKKDKKTKSAKRNKRALDNDTVEVISLDEKDDFI